MADTNEVKPEAKPVEVETVIRKERGEVFETLKSGEPVMRFRADGTLKDPQRVVGGKQSAVTRRRNQRERDAAAAQDTGTATEAVDEPEPSPPPTPEQPTPDTT